MRATSIFNIYNMLNVIEASLMCLIGTIIDDECWRTSSQWLTMA